MCSVYQPMQADLDAYLDQLLAAKTPQERSRLDQFLGKLTLQLARGATAQVPPVSPAPRNQTQSPFNNPTRSQPTDHAEVSSSPISSWSLQSPSPKKPPSKEQQVQAILTELFGESGGTAVPPPEAKAHSIPHRPLSMSKSPVVVTRQKRVPNFDRRMSRLDFTEGEQLAHWTHHLSNRRPSRTDSRSNSIAVVAARTGYETPQGNTSDQDISLTGRAGVFGDLSAAWDAAWLAPTVRRAPEVPSISDSYNSVPIERDLQLSQQPAAGIPSVLSTTDAGVEGTRSPADRFDAPAPSPGRSSDPNFTRVFDNPTSDAEFKPTSASVVDSSPSAPSLAPEQDGKCTASLHKQQTLVTLDELTKEPQRRAPLVNARKRALRASGVTDTEAEVVALKHAIGVNSHVYRENPLAVTSQSDLAPWLPPAGQSTHFTPQLQLQGSGTVVPDYSRDPPPLRSPERLESSSTGSAGPGDNVFIKSRFVTTTQAASQPVEAYYRVSRDLLSRTTSHKNGNPDHNAHSSSRPGTPGAFNSSVIPSVERSVTHRHRERMRSSSNIWSILSNQE